jgi:hypothetical protein
LVLLFVSLSHLTYYFLRPEGESFKVKLESVLLSPPTPLQIGDVVTFSYDNYTRYSLPVDPKIYRVRPDLDWKDVLRNFHEQSQSQTLNGMTFYVVLRGCGDVDVMSDPPSLTHSTILARYLFLFAYNFSFFVSTIMDSFINSCSERSAAKRVHH